MTTAIATTHTARALIVKESLETEAQQRQLLLQYVKSQMVENLDYGVIPGTDKPTLLKPGAEKLTKLFRTTPRFTIEKEIEDWDKGLFYYRFKCLIEDAEGHVVAEGIGSANSHEKRYRWRTASRVCPFCKVAAITKSKFPPRDNPEAPPGWYCFNRKGGCGAQFPHDDQSITGQVEGRIENPDIADTVNSVQKIAKKRSLVDATLGLSLCSELFTQDLEDTVGDAGAGQVEVAAKPAPVPRTAPAEQKPTHADLLRKCQTLNDLATYWNCIPTHQQKQFAAVKDEMKAKLSPEPPQADHATGDGDPEEDAYIGKAMAQGILDLLGKLGIDWSEVRDNHGSGRGLADLAGFQSLMDVKVTDLSPAQGQRLYARLKEMAAKSREKAGAA